MPTSAPGRVVFRLVGLACVAVVLLCPTPLEGRVAVRARSAADDDARAAFHELLRLTDDATTRHFLVATPAWTETRIRWVRAARGRGRVVRQLGRCWPSLKAAREQIAHAHRLFTAARRRTDDTFALIARHKRLLAQASAAVRRTYACVDRLNSRATP
jgi:hypothetical protein